MKTYELHPRDGFESLTLVDRAPRALAPKEVRVRVRAVSLNYRDLIVARNARSLAAPIVPASDGAGEVVEIGADVAGLRPGDRVAAAFFPTWHGGPLSEAHHAAALGGGGVDGMLAEEVVLPEVAWVPLPASLSFEEAATLPCAGVTAYHALFEAARLRPGDAVLVQGTGGVSLFALQLARAAGARVVLTSGSPEKQARARALGAAAVLDYRRQPAWGAAAREASGGEGVDVAVEVGGPGTFDQTVAALRYGGTMSLLGVLTGHRGEVDTYAIIHKALRIAGVYVGSTAMFRGLLRAIEASAIRPVIDRVFPFGEARAAYAHLASGAHFGKVVVKLG